MGGLPGGSGGDPLLDPMCGSGTLVMGGAMMALAIPPGHARAFGFERLAGFDRRRWSEVRDAALARRKPKERLPIFGRDRYGEELKKARLNLEAAGPAPCVGHAQNHRLPACPPAGGGVRLSP